ncbi:MFS transporter [Dasania sp. GY-MA-18]|uniref:MFS transporter n=1 Tax=Dasania phycosphaerae TaxID=2950436 RepID=A0A9J6RMM2_9GAMM|nr:MULTISPECIES: MFS transporter [Dasania]MCR8923137.1 MFS transporter [Dasania sp. GY-MA-18]MCZ0865569.1 MFS transporter [Dasania phycosphaerae]MCZ0869294.1 MFS transporter [Dasania phycosphaerae]
MKNNTAEFDTAKAITAAIVFSFIGNAVFMGMPMLVGALSDNLGFTEQQVGWLASADLGGMCASSILTSLLVARVNRRYLVALGVVIAVLANYAASLFHDFESLVSLRVLAGFGSGICYATGVASLAGSHNTGRNFSILMFALVAINALELYSFPILSAHWGVNGIFLAFAGSFILALCFIGWLPARAAEQSLAAVGDKQGPVVPVYLPWLCLLAVACFYITIGSYWSFIERAGVDAGLSDSFIANVLTAGTVCTLLGCFAATALSTRLGQSKPLIAALLGMTLTLLMLATGINALSYIAGTMLFNFMWLFTDIYQLGTLSNIDHSGRYVALVPAAQGFAQTLGPSMAGGMLAANMGYGSVMIMGALGSFAAFILYLLVYSILKRSAPAIANAQ